jgi:hypothetical protein
VKRRNEILSNKNEQKGIDSSPEMSYFGGVLMDFFLAAAIINGRPIYWWLL